ncbi:2OG-Fe dioxygenase family protein [Marinomonas spartinae]|nr:2OG-Fe dioxygenase family protein [Marinomonas spartinae]
MIAILKNLFLEILVVNDRVLYHQAEPVKQIDISRLAYRNLLLVRISVLQ